MNLVEQLFAHKHTNEHFPHAAERLIDIDKPFGVQVFTKFVNSFVLIGSGLLLRAYSYYVIGLCVPNKLSTVGGPLRLVNACLVPSEAVNS